MYLDETGSSLKTTVRRTWAPKGQTPIIQTCLNWSNLSIIGAITTDGRVFQHTYRHTVRAVHVIAFLTHVLRHVHGIVILDRAGIHRAKAIGAFLEEHPRLTLAFLPPYGPELNPVEWLWAYIKRNVIANFVARDLGTLHDRWKLGFQRVRQRIFRAVLPGAGRGCVGARAGVGDHAAVDARAWRDR